MRAFGANLGKLILGMRVVKANADRAGWTAALVRGAVFAIPGAASVAFQAGGLDALASLAGLAGLAVTLPILWTARRQGFHDKAAGTVVVRRGAAAAIIDDPWMRAAAPAEPGSPSHSW